VDVYHSDLIGIILTGANNDGAYGLQLIKNNGGLTLVQNPSEAESAAMPQAAIAAGGADEILSAEEIGNLLIRLDKKQQTPVYS